MTFTFISLRPPARPIHPFKGSQVSICHSMSSISRLVTQRQTSFNLFHTIFPARIAKTDRKTNDFFNLEDEKRKFSARDTKIIEKESRSIDRRLTWTQKSHKSSVIIECNRSRLFKIRGKLFTSINQINRWRSFFVIRVHLLIVSCYVSSCRYCIYCFAI